MKPPYLLNPREDGAGRTPWVPEAPCGPEGWSSSGMARGSVSKPGRGPSWHMV